MDELILKLLKMDLMIQSERLDDYLKVLVQTAKKLICREGIGLQENYEDSLLVEMYAAYLYRKRKEDVAMPRMLRFALNNRLLGESANG